MLKLMILDDEPAELDCLAKMICWEDYGYELCYVLENSEKAYEIITTENIDVLITDISMPHPDGIELARLIYENHPSVTVVFISAFSNFEYAQKALLYRVFSYITKPFSYKQITDTLNQIRAERLSDSSSDALISLISVQQSILDYCAGLISDNSLQQNYTRNFSYPFYTQSTPVVLLSANISNLSEYLQNTWRHELDRLYMCIIRYLNNSFVNFVPINFFFSQIPLLAFPTHESYTQNALEIVCAHAIEDFVSVSAKELKLKIDISILSVHPNLPSVKEALNESNFLPKSQIKPNIEHSDDIIDNAIAYISEHYSEPISIVDVSSAVGFSPYYFSRLFKRSMNETIANYITSVRLSKAAELLISTDMNISDIAKNVGYNSVPHFHKAFKSMYHLTPREYRLQQ